MVFTTNIISITTNTTLSTMFDVYIVNASGGNIIITLPTITCDGMQYKLKRTDNTPANTVTIQGTGGQTIDGVTTFLLNSLSCCEIQSFTSVWYITQNSQLVTGLTTYYNAYRNTGASVTISTTATGTNITFNTIRVSNAEAGTWATGGAGANFTIPETGIYIILYNIYVNNASGFATRTVSSCVTQNSTTPAVSGVIAGFGGTVTFPTNHTNIICGSGIVSLTSGDVIRVYARASGGSITILAATNIYTLDNTRTSILFNKIA
jgi:hypothetical protein